ncbi:hypothetical protein FRC10_011808 [Ceratobasidium sp. 414]|nr:hypothetical protein FRC10_011808 [Ceratobasidium sp. 414]
MARFPDADITEESRKQFDHKNGLINPGGSITLTIGTVFNRPIPSWGLVSGVAGATESTTRGLALDLKPTRTRVNTVSPGIVNTEFWNVTPKDAKDGIFSHAEKNLLVGHVGTAAEVAEAYIFAMKARLFAITYSVV